MDIFLTSPNAIPLAQTSYSSDFLSLPVPRKRGREEDVFLASSPIRDAKRVQEGRIHSQIHTNTIELMMNAQRLLQQQKHEPPQIDLEEPVEFVPTQKPFWPEIVKKRT